MVSDVYFPRVNGVSTSIQTFARELRAAGHSITLIAPDYGAAADEEFDIIRIPARRVPTDPEDRLMHYRKVLALDTMLMARRFDIVHIQTPFVAHYAGLGLAYRLGVPVVETYHTFFEAYFDKYVTFLPGVWLRGAARRFSRRQCNSVNRVIAPSAMLRDVLRGYGVRTPIEVIPTGIERERFSGGDGEGFRKRCAIPPDWKVLVHVGRVAHEKNIGFLLQVLERLRHQEPKLLLIIAGEGPARRSLEREVAARGLGAHVLFVGYLQRDGQVQDCFCAGDVFVFASRTETQGLVLLESMALGVPVVSTAIMGTRSIMQAGRGGLVAEEEAGQFAGQVQRLLSDRVLHQRLAAEAVEYAHEWSAPSQARRLLALYDQVIEEHMDSDEVKSNPGLV